MNRADAIVLCSCGLKVGNSARARMHEDMERLERGIMASRVPILVRHWRLGHILTLQAKEFADVIATVAAKMAESDEPSPADAEIAGFLDDGSMLRCGTFR